MPEALFVSQTWITDNTPINEFVEVSLIVPHVQLAQDTHVQELLGTELYEHLQSAVVNNTLTEPEKSLLKIVRRALAYWTLEDSIPFISSRVRNAGVTKSKSASAENASISEVIRMENMSRSAAQFYAQRAINYLCTNASSFPLYPGSKDISASRGTEYSGGIYMWSNDRGCGYGQDDTHTNGCGCN